MCHIWIMDLWSYFLAMNNIDKVNIVLTDVSNWLEISEISSPFQCHLCGRHFSKKENMEVHIQAVHLKERPHRCKHCLQTFSQKGHMINHILGAHEGVKPFKCDCGSSFAAKKTLRDHKATHKPIQDRLDFTCAKCDLTYVRKSSLNRHLKNAH